MAFSIEEIIMRDGTCVVYIQSEEELITLQEVWSELNGCKLDFNILKPYAAKSDLCLELGYNSFTGRYDWTWGNKVFYFGATPMVRIYKLNELMPSRDDLGEIKTDETSVFDLFIGAVCDLKLLEGDPCD